MYFTPADGPYPHRPRPLTATDRDRMAYAWLVAAERRFPPHITTSTTTEKESTNVR